MNKRKNPLYVVTNNGKNVEEANGLFEALLKRFGVEELIQTLVETWNMLVAQIRTYGLIETFKQYLDELITKLEIVEERLESLRKMYTN